MHAFFAFLIFVPCFFSLFLCFMVLLLLVLLRLFLSILVILFKLHPRDWHCSADCTFLLCGIRLGDKGSLDVLNLAPLDTKRQSTWGRKFATYYWVCHLHPLSSPLLPFVFISSHRPSHFFTLFPFSQCIKCAFLMVALRFKAIP